VSTLLVDVLQEFDLLTSFLSVGDLALDNEHPISSGISQNPIGSPSHQQLEVDNLQLLGPSIARR